MPRAPLDEATLNARHAAKMAARATGTPVQFTEPPAPSDTDTSPEAIEARYRAKRLKHAKPVEAIEAEKTKAAEPEAKPSDAKPVEAPAAPPAETDKGRSARR